MADFHIDFSDAIARASISRLKPDGSPTEGRVWSEISHLVVSTDGESTIGPSTISMEWSSYLLIAQHIARVARRNSLRISYGLGAQDLIERWKKDQFASHGHVVTSDAITSQNLDEELEKAGWDLVRRSLTREQRRDAVAASSLRHSAIFSVPGAGKTTVALAVHQLFSTRRFCRLLVIAPNNAFPAWDEALESCLVDQSANFVRLVGGESAIRLRLNNDPRYAIISYAQLARVGNLLQEHVLQFATHLVLDESHRIKAGRQGQIATEVAKLAPFAIRRDILSGTPMPQSKADLEPQFEFLYPATDVGQRIRNAAQLQHVIGSLFVRTRYSELGVPRPSPEYVAVDMNDTQRLLYAFLRDQFVRRFVQNREELGSQRLSVMRLMMACIDPQTAAERLLALPESPSELRDICMLVIEEGLSPRLQEAIRRVDEIVSSGRKVVLWAPFNLTLERLHSELINYGPRILYGQTPAGDVDEEGTREQIVHQFHSSEACRVLIANPAAGGEGISLHKVCQDAVYVGRTYNATHFMQSRDRICRLGMPAGSLPKITVIESRAPGRLGSVDLSIRNRLDLKIAQMADALDDPDLRQIALESEDAEAALDDGLTFDDLLDLLKVFTGQS